MDQHHSSAKNCCDYSHYNIKAGKDEKTGAPLISLAKVKLAPH